MKCSGPIFDGRAIQAAKEGTDAVRRRLANEAEHLAAAAFMAQIRENHGRFERSITQTRVSRAYTTVSGHKAYTLPIVVEDPSTDTVVTTELATYGPWLEGTGSRNETTRFKGYNGFRRAGQALELVAQEMSDASFAPYAERMR